MPLWFEIIVVAGLFAIAVKLDGIEHNIANFGTRLETKIMDRLEEIIRGRDRRSGPTFTDDFEGR
jgi:hypothetical protein